jgi:hypothetical protein
MSCECCEIDCAAPDVSITSTGHSMVRGNMSEAKWAEIPAAYKAMKWLVRVFNETEATYQYRTYCDDDAGANWILNIEVTKTGVYWRQEYDPEDGYSLENQVGGTETDVRQQRPDACDDPPDLTYTLNDSWSGTWAYSEILSAPLLTYSGTDKDGEPISGTLSGHGYSGLINSAAPPISTLDLTDTYAIENTLRDWDGVILTAENPDRHYIGQETIAIGYRNLSPIIVTITPPAVPFQQVKYQVILIHWDTAAETVVAEDEWLYHSGDDPLEIEFEPAHPGTVKVTALYRCSRKMPFEKLIAEE